MFLHATRCYRFFLLSTNCCCHPYSDPSWINPAALRSFQRHTWQSFPSKPPLGPRPFIQCLFPSLHGISANCCRSSYVLNIMTLVSISRPLSKKEKESSAVFLSTALYSSLCLDCLLFLSAGVLVCKTVPFVQTTAIVTGILTMTCIAIERYQGIVFPLKMRRQNSPRRAYTMLGIQCIHGRLTGLPRMIASVCLTKPLRT